MQLRIKLESKPKERASGPNMFMSRIVKYIKENYDVKFTSKKPNLAFGSIFLPSKVQKRVVRIDGCYYNKSHFSHPTNKALSTAIKKATGVIFQSDFSRNMCQKLLGVEAKQYCVIPNGIDFGWVDSIAPVNFKESNVFAAVASWRNSKRPKSIIKSFIDAKIPDSRLLVIGKFEKPIKNDKITYLGNLPSNLVIANLKSCKALIHLCKIESCPNAVVEALSCKIPVICNNIGGTPEIVKNNGIIVNCDEPYNFKYIDEKDVDNINTKDVASALVQVLENRWEIDRSYLDIKECAEKYYNFFKLIINV